MNTEPTTLDEMGARVSAAAAETAAAMAAATDLMRRAGEEVQEAAATMEIAVGHLKRYQPPASDRPSGAARKRLRWSEQAARSKDWRRLRLLGQEDRKSVV